VLAKMVQALEPAEGQKVLDVGCATGYAAALLAHLGLSVIALEQDDALVQAARNGLRNTDNVEVVQGRLSEGYPSRAAYDSILVEGRIEVAPEKLCLQLAPGGRLVCIEGEGPAPRAMLYHRDAAGVSARPVFNAAGPLLPGFAKPPQFVF
jgi:protein-L-isoaspartate(D-aspartate) O-methyltransferase